MLINLTEGIAGLKLRAVGIDRQQVGIAVAFVGHTVAGIVEYHLGIAMIGTAYFIYVVHCCSYVAESGVVVHADILLRQTECAVAVLGKHSRIVQSEIHLRHTLIILIADDYGKCIGVFLGRLRYIEVNDIGFIYLTVGGRGVALGFFGEHLILLYGGERSHCHHYIVEAILRISVGRLVDFTVKLEVA